VPRKVVWDDIPWEPIHESVDRKVVMGDHLMLVLYRFRKGLTWPEEQHFSEQGGYILEGKVEFHSGDDTLTLGPGDSYFIESNAIHYTSFLEETVLIDIFAPPRKNLMEKDQAFAPDQT
jgi:quercetin dioxygenase-like cupin family protein